MEGEMYGLFYNPLITSLRTWPSVCGRVFAPTLTRLTPAFPREATSGLNFFFFLSFFYYFPINESVASCGQG